MKSGNLIPVVKLESATPSVNWRSTKNPVWPMVSCSLLANPLTPAQPARAYKCKQTTTARWRFARMEQIKSNQISFQVSTDKTRTRFPILAKIAQDVFSVCASSCPSETQFSKARKVANPWRSNLGHKSMQATLCLKSSYLMPELRGFEPVGQ